MKIIDVNSGEIKIVERDALLRVSALGSCVAIVAYEGKSKIGGIAHCMLPGKSPNKKDKKKYAIDAIDELLEKMIGLGVKIKDIKISIVGGGNVLRRKEDRICERNIQSIVGYLNEKKIKIRGSSLGGFERRSVFLNTTTGEIIYTVGNSAKKTLKKTGL
ncbi:MAG: chemotaxis protein CheD [Elusimicrobiales bacterium]|nr:chemotaxis protein CheD [Elusimicrobiales bacterium]